MSGSTVAVNVPVSGRVVALACLAIAGLCLGGSLFLSTPPMPSPHSGLPGLLPWIPYAAGLFALISGGLSLQLDPPQAKLQPPDPDSTLVPALQVIFRDFNSLIMEERDRLAAFKELFGTTTQEAMNACGRLSKLATSATDVETRLAASVSKAEQALQQPTTVVGWAAEAAQRVEQALPDLAEMIRRGIAEQSEAANAAFEAAATKLATAADSPVQIFHDAVSSVVGQVTAFGESADKFRQDMTGLDLVGRQIASAAAVVVARVGDAVGHFDTALSTLPTAATAFTTAAEQAAQTVAEAAVTLAADGAALDASGRQALQIVEALRTAGQVIAEHVVSAGQDMRETGEAIVMHVSDAKRHVDAAFDRLPAVAAELTAAADHAAQGLSEAGAVLRADGVALSERGRETLQAAETLRAAGQDVASASAEAVATAGRAVAHVDDALAGLSAVTAAVTGSADQAAATLAKAADAMRADSASLEASGQKTMLAADTLQSAGHEMLERLDHMRQELNAAGDTIAAQTGDVLSQVDAAVAQLPAAAIVMTTSSDRAAHAIEQAASALHADSVTARSALLAAAQETVSAAGTLRAAGEEMRGVCAAAISQAGHAAAQVDAAVALLPELAASVDAAADQAVHGLTAVAASLSARGEALDAAGREALHRVDTLRAAEQAIIGAGHQAITTVAETVETVAGRMATVIADADRAQQAAISMSERLEAATSRIEDRASELDAAGRRVASVGEGVAEQLASSAAAHTALLLTLPDAAAQIAGASAGLKGETQALTAAAQQITANSGAAKTAMTDLLSRVDGAIASADAASRGISLANATVTEQAGHLTEATGKAGAQVSLMQAVAADVSSAVEKLAVTTAMLQSTLEAQQAAKSSAATSAADASLDASSAAAKFSALGADMTEALNRFEAVLAHHDAAWPAVADSIVKVQAAVTEVQSALEARPASSHGLNGAALSADTPAALAGTLTHLGEVSARTNLLLHQTEALAEAVLQGRAPGLPLLLADRTPGLLVEVETTIRRLRAVSTALALASDGPALPAAERRTS